jgi:small subunit ribosomal protein S21
LATAKERLTMEVKRKKNETSENLVKRFIRKSKKSGIIEEYRERSHYKKPSVRKREEKAKNIANVKREQKKREMNEKRSR